MIHTAFTFDWCCPAYLPLPFLPGVGLHSVPTLSLSLSIYLTPSPAIHVFYMSPLCLICTYQWLVNHPGVSGSCPTFTIQAICLLYVTFAFIKTTLDLCMDPNCLAWIMCEYNFTITPTYSGSPATVWLQYLANIFKNTILKSWQYHAKTYCTYCLCVIKLCKANQKEILAFCD